MHQGLTHNRTLALCKASLPIAILMLGVMSWLMISNKAEAAIPKLMNFQGKLTKTSDGTNVADGNYNMEFKIYDQPTGGNLLWTEDWVSTTTQVSIVNGVFTVKLGSINSLANVDFTGGSLYLTINVNITGSYDGEMLPRKQLLAAAFAFNANNLVGDGRIAITATSTAQSAMQITYNPDTATTAAASLITASSNVQGPALKVVQNGTGASALFSGGNVGIGTATPASLLQVAGDIRLGYAANTAGRMIFQNSANSFTATLQSASSTMSGNLAWTLPSADGNGCLKSDGSGAMSIGSCASGGGVAASGTPGMIQFYKDSSTLNANAYFAWDNTNLKLSIGTTSTSSTVTIQGKTGTGDLLDVSSSTGVSVLRVTDGGNVGIGTTSPIATLSVASANVQDAFVVNQAGSGNIFRLQQNGTDKLIVNNTGTLTINGSDSSIVRQTVADFALGAIGTSLDNSDGALSLADTKAGGIPNGGKGTITTGGPTTSAAIGAGAFSITRADGLYLVIRGGGSTGMDIYDSFAGTFTNSSQTLNAAAGAGAIALPRPGGRYRILHGGGTTTSSLVDPLGAAVVGPNVTAASKATGTVAFLRPDGRFLVTNAPSVATTQIYDPISDSFVTGPVGSGGNWGAGAVVLSRTDGQALVIVGGTASTTQLYNPSAGAITGGSPVGAFTVGPTLDGKQAVGTCSMNGNGSVAFRRQDGKFVILSKANVWAVYDPVANTITCNPSGGPGTAIGDGGHAIPLQNGKFLVIVGGGSQKAYIYNPTDDSFTDYGGTPLTAVTTGAHSLMRQDGTWQILVGGGQATNNYDTGLPMSDNNTLYISEDIFNSSLNSNSTFWWRTQMESVYAAARNNATNTAFSSLQFLVMTAQSSNGLQSGCATPLNNATPIEIRNSGDLIQTAPGANCVRVKAQFNRPLPKRLFDERGTWVGNGMTNTRLDYVTPRLYNFKIDNSAVLRRANFDFVFPNATVAANPTIPGAPTVAVAAGAGCTAGTHSYFVTFVTAGVESSLGTRSAQVNCTGGNLQVNISAIPTGPAGTTARKIYRTPVGDSYEPLFLTTIADNITTVFTDNTADTALGAAFGIFETSGPVMTRSETRVEAVNGNLVLPYGRLTQTLQVGTSGYYMGSFSAAHPPLTNTTGQGTVVIARDDKTFLIIESGGQYAELYDPATETFTNQTTAGDKPTGTIGTGAFALKRPDGNFLVYLGAGATTAACATAGTATNIYDPNQASGSRFTNGPCLTAAGGLGAQAILNNDGTYTILHGNATTATSLYNPVTNSMIVGPITTTAVNCGSWAIPMGLPHNNQYKVKAGVAPAGTAVATGVMNYDADSKVFSAAPNLTAITGCGSIAFQRQDGYWVITEGETAGANGLVTNIMNPLNGTTAAGPSITAPGPGRGSHVIPRPDGTFLVINGNPATAGSVVSTNIYFPTGGAAANALGVPAGTWGVGPMFGPGVAPAAAPTAGTPTSGGSVTSGTHTYKFTYVTNGVESLPSAASGIITASSTAGTVPLSAVTAGPTGTTSRRIYRTVAGNTGNYLYLATIDDNTTTTYSDTLADTSLGAAVATNGFTGPGDGALSFQRPDGKFVVIFGGSTASRTTGLYDAGWYSEGQYLSEMMQVSPLAANAVLEWQKTADPYVRFEARAANSQALLDTTPFNGVDSPGQTINNSGGETWVQVEINFRRDFPTFCGNLNSVYVSGAGMAYCNRTISLPTVMQYQITNGQDLLTLQTNSYNVLRVTSSGGIYSSQQGGFFAGGADLAENYTSTQSLDKGEVVTLDPNNSQGVLRSSFSYQSTVLGVVSTAPGFVAGSYTDDSYPIALIGRVPVKVSTENGSIKAGDYLTSASLPGFAMKATRAGRALGIATEDLDESKLNSCPANDFPFPGQRRCGTVTIFVNLINYNGESVELAMTDALANANNTADLSVTSTDISGLGLDPADVSSTPALAAPGQFIQTLGEMSKQQQILAFLKQLKSSQQTSATGKLSEIFTDRLSAVSEIITPSITTDTLTAREIQVDIIRARQIEGLEILTDKISVLTRQVNGLETAASSTPALTDFTSSMPDAASTSPMTLVADNQTLSALVFSGPVQFGAEAVFEKSVTVQGTLVAGDIQSPQFTNLASTTGDLLSRITALEKISASPDGTVGASSTPAANLAILGGLTVDSIGSAGDILALTSDTVFIGRPYFTADTAGFAVIRQGSTGVDITFDRQYLEQPIINASITVNSDQASADAFAQSIFASDIRYLITNKSEKGFAIILNKPVSEDIQFSWIALAVKSARTFSSKQVDATVSSDAAVGAGSAQILPTVLGAATSSADILTSTTTPAAAGESQPEGAPLANDSAVASSTAPVFPASSATTTVGAAPDTAPAAQIESSASSSTLGSVPAVEFSQ